MQSATTEEGRKIVGAPTYFQLNTTHQLNRIMKYGLLQNLCDELFNLI